MDLKHTILCGNKYFSQRLNYLWVNNQVSDTGSGEPPILFCPNLKYLSKNVFFSSEIQESLSPWNYK